MPSELLGVTLGVTLEVTLGDTLGEILGLGEDESVDWVVNGVTVAKAAGVKPSNPISRTRSASPGAI